MARAREAFNKKDREKAMIVKRKEKEKKKEERKVNSKKSKGLDDMLAYVDSYGNIVSAPPDPANRQEIKVEDIRISISKKEDIEQASPFRTGTITFFNDSKGYGFIKDNESGESIFVHANNLESPVKENDKVSFETSRGPKGLNAVNVKLA
jgi:cold shock CspA family protein